MNMKCSPQNHMLRKWSSAGDAGLSSLRVFRRLSLAGGSELLSHAFRAIIYWAFHKLSPLPDWLRYSMPQYRLLPPLPSHSHYNLITAVPSAAMVPNL